ncbi:MAG TPA: tetratricopeptide repeat protein [Pyrinomonadaceae bacterium]|nr:tetratricopeptide repeat protein [Pyrinomonadaceae bacterium]
MLIQTLDFHFRKQFEGSQLEIYLRNSSQPLSTVQLDFPTSFLSGFELKQLDFDAKDPAGRVHRLREFGQRLHKRIFATEVAQVWEGHKLKHEFLVLCIRIAPEASELEAIPWETLFDGEEFIAAGTKTTLTRLPLDVQPQLALSGVPSPLKMLALVSSPLDLPDNSRLQMEREQEILLEAINDPAGQGRLRADFEDEAKLEILESSLETPYQVFHFTGHGMAPEDGGGLLLEDAQGNSRPTSVAEVLQSLQRGENSLRLVVLSGCQTARTINVGGFRDMARGLLRRRIPSVIAMQFSISDGGGLKFAEAFYGRIAAGRTLELASHAARRALLLSDDYFLQADALAPVLLTSNGDCLQTLQPEAASAAEPPKIDFSFYLPLPQLSYGFYGRRSEYRQVRDGILHRNQRAVIIHGIGGIGKTALVSHIGTRLRKRFQGVYAFDCSGGTLTPETVMIKLHGFFAPQGVKALEQLLYQNLPSDVLANYLAQVLSQWSLLLIFDNFESQLELKDPGFQIADENLRAFITTLIKTTATASHFLFTSRYLFELDDKRLGNIQSLPLEDLSRPEALSLMQKLQHLAAASHAEKLEALKTFGGHPYGLVTLDRYCNHQPLDRALKDAASIHAELRVFLAIELNYARLSELSRELLNRLAAFRQSVPHEAAEWVMGKKISYAAEFLESSRSRLPKEWGTLGDSRILEELERLLPERRQAEDLSQPIRELVEWGLLTPTQKDGEILELSIHALVRDFCRDKQQGETWQRRLRDAAVFYINLTKLDAAENKSQAMVWNEMEAFELLVEAQEFNDAASVLMDATPHLDRWGFGRYLEAQHRRLFEKLDNEIAGLLINFGNIIQARGEYDEALQCYLRSLELSEELGDRANTASSLHQIGIMHYRRGRYEEALEYYERSRKIQEELNDPAGMASSLYQIGTLHRRLGEDEKALDYTNRSLAISEAVGERRGAALSLHQIGKIHRQRGEHDVALEYYERSLDIFKEIGDRSGEAYALGEIGIIHRLRGKYDRALENYERVLGISEDIGDRFSVAITLGQIGKMFVDLRRFEEAFQHLLSALNIFIDLQLPDAGFVAGDLNILRGLWGREHFDAAWRKATGEDVPEWLKE